MPERGDITHPNFLVRVNFAAVATGSQGGLSPAQCRL